MPEMNYVMAQSVDVDAQHMPKERGAINGGLFQRPKEAPNPVIYVDVGSVLHATTLFAVAELYENAFSPFASTSKKPTHRNPCY